MEHKFGANNYHPIPIVFSKAKGAEVWDVEGKKYLDFLSAYSAVNQGHCHPRILESLTQQASRLTLSSRAFYNDIFPRYTKYVTSYFGFESVLPMNTGAEAVETAFKLARKWGYSKKKIPEGQAIIVCVSGCFHGRTITAISISDDPDSFAGYEPKLGGIQRIEYNNLSQLKELLKKDGDRICAFIVEPIQGEAGVVVPEDGYLSQCAKICREHNVLFIADEIQTGLCRTGKMLACDYDKVKPDVLILGKALSGGYFPISCVLSSAEIMHTIQPGQHGSTFGGSSLSAAVAITSLEVLIDENLADNAFKQGEIFRSELKKSLPSFVTDVRGKGLLNAIEIDPKFRFSAWEICMLFAQKGILCKPTHDHIIRLSPPLVLTKQQTDEALQVIKQTFSEIPKLDKSHIPKEPKFH